MTFGIIYGLILHRPLSPDPSEMLASNTQNTYSDISRMKKVEQKIQNSYHDNLLHFGAKCQCLRQRSNLLHHGRGFVFLYEIALP